MRKIAQSNQREELLRFRAFLKQLGVECEVRPLAEMFSLWVYDEKDLNIAQTEWAIFLTDKDNSKYTEALQVERHQEQKLAVKQMAEGWIAKPKALATKPGTQLTIALIYISVFFWLMSLVSPLRPLISKLLISEYISPRFLEIKDGQVWRLLTPIFIHGDILHLGFNMLWLYQLGRQIELVGGRIFMLLLVLFTGIVANLAEYYYTGPLFGGMSGVVYGMLAYIFLRERLDPSSGYRLDNTTMVIMLVWLAVGFTGMFGRIANANHLGGLVAGGVLAFILNARSARR